MECLVLNEERGMVFRLPTVISGAGDPGQKPWFYFWWKGKKKSCCSQMTPSEAKVTSGFRISQELGLSFLCELLPRGRAYLRCGWVMSSCLLGRSSPCSSCHKSLLKAANPGYPRRGKAGPISQDWLPLRRSNGEQGAVRHTHRCGMKDESGVRVTHNRKEVTELGRQFLVRKIGKLENQ